jgi:Tol biopolymer transport system component
LFFAGGAITADGTRLAFASSCNLTGQNVDANFEIYRFDTTANTLTQITTSSGCHNGFGDTFRSGVISADGTRIAFLSDCNLTGQNADGNQEIYLFDSPTNTPSQITTTSGCRQGFPSINADGTRIVFASDCNLTGQNADSNFEVYHFDTSTDTLTQITTSSDCGTALTSINGDGTRIAFDSNCNLTGQNADGNAEIYLFDTTTSTLTQITTTNGCDNGVGSYI